MIHNGCPEPSKIVYGKSKGHRASVKRITLPLELYERPDEKLLRAGRREAKDGVCRPSICDTLPDRIDLPIRPG